MRLAMSVNDFVLAQGMRDTRGALRRWNADPLSVLGRWAAGALAIAVALLLCVWAIASAVVVDPTTPVIAGLNSTPQPSDVGHILLRNSLVLALHAFACVAGFIAGSSLVLSAEQRSGLSRWVHEKARPIALGWVVLVTAFSLFTQAVALGLTGAQLAGHLAISPGVLLLTVLPHAIPELLALFLPLAAWTIASRRDEWRDLLAATFATVAFAVPVLVASATWEVYVWPHILAAVSPAY
jgi:Stage II sporulation protein M